MKRMSLRTERVQNGRPKLTSIAANSIHIHSGHQMTANDSEQWNQIKIHFNAAPSEWQSKAKQWNVTESIRKHSARMAETILNASSFYCRVTAVRKMPSIFNENPTIKASSIACCSSNSILTTRMSIMTSWNKKYDSETKGVNSVRPNVMFSIFLEKKVGMKKVDFA